MHTNKSFILCVPEAVQISSTSVLGWHQVILTTIQTLGILTFCYILCLVISALAMCACMFRAWSVGIFAKKLCKELWIMSELWPVLINLTLIPPRALIRCMGKSQFYFERSEYFVPGSKSWFGKRWSKRRHSSLSLLTLRNASYC